MVMMMQVWRGMDREGGGKGNKGGRGLRALHGDAAGEKSRERVGHRGAAGRQQAVRHCLGQCMMTLQVWRGDGTGGGVNRGIEGPQGGTQAFTITSSRPRVAQFIHTDSRTSTPVACRRATATPCGASLSTLRADALPAAAWITPLGSGIWPADSVCRYSRCVGGERRNGQAGEMRGQRRTGQRARV